MIQTVHIPRSAQWLPPSLLTSPEEIRHRIVVSESVRRVLRKHKKIPVSRWAELHRYVTMSVLPGRWRNEVTPYMAGIMDASFFQSVQTVIICKPPQWGGTEGVLTCIGYAIDRDPGPVLMVYPDELTGRENNQDRIQTMIKSSPRLKSYLTGTDDDTGMLRINLSHMPLYIAWARSASRLGNKPIRYVVFDEIDKYPDVAGKRETDPISLGEKRTTTYKYNRKVWKFSTPTIETGNVWTALTKEAQVIFDYYVTCPFCGHSHKMEFKNLEWAHETEPGPDGKCHSLPPETIEAEKLAWYKCPQCATLWNDYDRDRAVRSGKWCDRKEGIELHEYLRVKKPLKIGFHSSALISPFVSLPECSAASLRAKLSIEKLKDYYNNYRAEPWKLSVISKDEAQILAARGVLPPQTVPDGAIALTCGIDVQKSGFWFVVRAWGPDLKSWLIHYGFLETWDDVEKLLYETAYPVAETGRTMRIFRACIDTGGGDKYEGGISMTDNTYYWLVKNYGRGGVRILGVKGSSNHADPTLHKSKKPLTDSQARPLPISLWIINTQTMKDQFHYRIERAAKEDTRHYPEAAFLHRETGADYAAQILAEEKQVTEKGTEEWVNVHQRPNHLLDAEVYCMACVDMQFPGGGLRIVAGLKQEEKPQGRRVISAGVSETGWFKR